MGRVIGFVLLSQFLFAACQTTGVMSRDPTTTPMVVSIAPVSADGTPPPIITEIDPTATTIAPTSTLPTPTASILTTIVPAGGTPVADKTATPVPTRAPPARFDTLAPSAELPTAAECAAWVRRSSFEPRPENEPANHFVPPPLSVQIDGASKEFNARFASRVDGRFTGTTDEIIQWASCKWGFDEDLTRARAVSESRWRQSQEGDRTDSEATCAIIQTNAPCARSYGLLQVKATVHEGTYPWSSVSTAFNADYSLAWLRACYVGDFSWLKAGYKAGDVKGCVGAWFSGNWKDAGALRYLDRVLDHLANRPWESEGF